MGEDNALELEPAEPVRSEVKTRTEEKINGKAEPRLYMGLEEIVQNGGGDIPAHYILPPHLQPGLSSRTVTENLPVIDFTGIYDPEQRKQIVAAVVRACEEWGFFQVVHRVSPARQKMLAVARKFFELPASEKVKFQIEGRDAGLSYPVFGQGRATLSGHHSWRDVFKHTASPVSEVEVERWPTTPESYRETVLEYTEEVKKLVASLFELMAEGLHLDSQYFFNALGGVDNITYQMLSAYYPRCPQPELALGLIGHTDPNPMTIVIYDAAGLEVKKDGSWVSVMGEPDGFIVNIGDCLQIITNDKYVSAEHRVVANEDEDRVSVMHFIRPDRHVKIGVEPELVTHDSPARYKDTTWNDYLEAFGSHGLDKKFTDLVLK